MNEKADLGNTDDNSIIDEKIQLGEEKSKAIAHKDSSLKRLDVSFNKHIELGEYKKSNVLAYWINDFAKYHDEESTFDLNSFKIFKRGDIINANLGFNIGKELGGLHFCIVLNKNDNPYNGTLNVIPLSSAKENKTFNTNTCIDLGNELYLLLKAKLDNEVENFNRMIIEQHNNSSSNDIKHLTYITKKLKYIKSMEEELSRMKCGSFALVHQITTISKQRIFKSAFLAKIKLSNASLDKIDSKISKLFMK